jgi:hypothetical protein
VEGKDCFKDTDLYNNLFGTGHLIFMCVFLFGVGLKFRHSLQGTDIRFERHELGCSRTGF